MFWLSPEYQNPHLLWATCFSAHSPPSVTFFSSYANETSCVWVWTLASCSAVMRWKIHIITKLQDLRRKKDSESCNWNLLLQHTGQQLETHKMDDSLAFPQWHFLPARFLIHPQVLAPRGKKKKKVQLSCKQNLIEKSVTAIHKGSIWKCKYSWIQWGVRQATSYTKLLVFLFSF